MPCGILGTVYFYFLGPTLEEIAVIFDVEEATRRPKSYTPLSGDVEHAENIH
jgi:hypothetical protein